MSQRFGLVSGFVLGLTAFGAGSASATVTFLPGNVPQQPGEQNILFNTGNNGPGSMVTGSTSQSGTVVDFSTTTGQSIFTNSQGQAKIQTNDNGGFLTSMMVDVPNHTFTDFIVNLNSLQSSGATISVIANEPGGGTQTFTDDFAQQTPNGQNFITIVASGGETISSITYASTGGFGAFQQPRISGISGVAVIPEPSTWVMLVLGFSGLGYAAFRRSRKDHISALA
jgi:PEP-CTERM motif-containing protein